MAIEWQFQYRDARGFVVTLSGSGADGKDSLGQLGAAVDYVLKQGGAPVDPFAQQPSQAAVSQAGSNGAESGGEGYCTIHQCDMRWHDSNDARGGWWSHKLEDGTWCNGKPPKRGSGRR